MRATEAELLRVYRETIDRVYRYASRKCDGRREIAEDVVQEAWLRAVRDWPRAGMPDNPIAWLTTVVHNLMLNHARRAEFVAIDDVSPGTVLAAVDDDSVGESEHLTSIVNNALTRIPNDEAQLLRKFHFERFKVAQLAVSYGISERAIEGRLRRARERLRHELELSIKTDGGMP